MKKKSTNGSSKNKNLHAEMKMLEQISLDFCDGRFKSKLIFDVLDSSISNGEFAVSKFCCLNCSLLFKSLAILNDKEWDYFDKKLGTHCEATNMWFSSSFLVKMVNNCILQDVDNLDFLEARGKLEEIYSAFVREEGIWKEANSQVKESNYLVVYQNNTTY